MHIMSKKFFLAIRSFDWGFNPFWHPSLLNPGYASDRRQE